VGQPTYTYGTGTTAASSQDEELQPA